MSTSVKRRNPEQTRARILSCAFDLFVQQGYARTGIRDIALQADISSSLISRYFGSKSQLFEEALIHGIGTHSVFVHEKERFGERMAQRMVSESTPVLTTMMVLAMADDESRAIAQRVSQRYVLEPLAKWLGSPNAKSRAHNLLALMHGFSIQTQLLHPGKVSPASLQWLAQSLQEIVDA